MTEPRTARAADKPCELYAHTSSPIPSRTQGHHRHPVYLQNRVYGQIRDPELLWLCGLCHDNVHEVISWLLGESRQPIPMPGLYAIREARRTVAWYRNTLGPVITAGQVRQLGPEALDRINQRGNA